MLGQLVHVTFVWGPAVVVPAHVGPDAVGPLGCDRDGEVCVGDVSVLAKGLLEELFGFFPLIDENRVIGELDQGGDRVVVGDPLAPQRTALSIHG